MLWGCVEIHRTRGAVDRSLRATITHYLLLPTTSYILLCTRYLPPTTYCVLLAAYYYLLLPPLCVRRVHSFGKAPRSDQQRQGFDLQNRTDCVGSSR